MKKTCLLFLFALVLACFVFAEEYTVSTYSFTDPDYYSEKTMRIRFDDETKEYMFQFSNSYSTLWMVFTEKDLESMRLTAQKALEWEKIAIDNKAQVSKEIPNSTIYMELYESSSSFYSGTTKVPVTFTFIATEGAGLTCLMIVGGKTTATSNRYIDIEFQGQLLIGKEIQLFADAISEETITNGINKHNNATSVADDLFN